MSDPDSRIAFVVALRDAGVSAATITPEGQVVSVSFFPTALVPPGPVVDLADELGLGQPDAPDEPEPDALRRFVSRRSVS